MGAVTRPKAVTSVLKALRGYTLTVWAMVAFMTSPSKFGRRAVEIAVAAGGSLLALAILVPAMPLALILAGVLLVVAGVSAAALRTDPAKGVGRRLSVVGLIVAAALGGYLYWDWRANGLGASVIGALVKIGVFLLIVLLGLWISTARPRPAAKTAGRAAKGGRTDAAGNRPEQRHDGVGARGVAQRNGNVPSSRNGQADRPREHATAASSESFDSVVS